MAAIGLAATTEITGLTTGLGGGVFLGSGLFAAAVFFGALLRTFFAGASFLVGAIRLVAAPDALLPLWRRPFSAALSLGFIGVLRSEPSGPAVKLKPGPALSKRKARMPRESREIFG
ncbi:MAG TPA: hypothetical protein VN832_14620 [Stellaceae bacterium]|nr:hypothetical protein [Stellaceae bacterium]